MPRKFFYDTEFIERPGLIDLISIGVVGEDGSEFYAVSRDCHFPAANQWVRENVLPHLPPFDDPAWMTRDQIRDGLLAFLKPSEDDPVELWGYCSAYDHVALCWLFGAMIDLPPGMPMYTRDIKQLSDHLGSPLPGQAGTEHDALCDARWNRKAFAFLESLEFA